MIQCIQIPELVQAYTYKCKWELNCHDIIKSNLLLLTVTLNLSSKNFILIVAAENVIIS